MPMYDFKCPAGCGYFNDIYVPLAQHGKTTCPECNAKLETVISEVALVGPMPSKPLVVKQVGKSFENGADWREYQRKNPDCEILSADSTAWRKHRDMAAEKAEATARRMGYRDLADKKKRRKKERDKQSGKLDRNIYIH
jgi:putative FmdB family regulatory protein|tara:strand:- start:313 stop:729 length:417 start_codon:yes stop_codon:yes gene_type:complete